MNNKGQTLVTFVIILPFLVVFLAYIVDTGWVAASKAKIDSTVKMIPDLISYEDPIELEEKVRHLFNKNDIKIEDLNIIYGPTYEEINLKFRVKSIFGQIIGLEYYDYQRSISTYKDQLSEG